MAQFRSNENPMFRSKFSEDIFKQKYAHHNCETWDALASVLVDDVCQNYMSKDDKEELKRIITDLKFILVVDISTMLDVIISFLTTATCSRQKKIQEKTGLIFHGSLSPAL